MTQEAMRGRIFEYSVNLSRCQTNIQRDNDYSQPTARIHQLQVIRFVGKQKGEAVATFQALTVETGREFSDTRVTLEK